MDTERKQLWDALCRVGAATEDDRAEAADQRAQADEEKAEAERNMADSDRLKEGSSKEAVSPGQAVQIMNNRMIEHHNSQSAPAAMSEDEDEESGESGESGGSGGKKAWDHDYDDRDDYEYEDFDTPTCREQDSWDDMNATGVRTGERHGRKFIKMLKAMGWTIQGSGFEVLGDELEETGEGWALLIGDVDLKGKGGQKMLLPRGKSIVLDRNLTENVGIWALFDTTNENFEVDTGRTDGDGWSEPKEPVMADVDIECPDVNSLDGIGFSYDTQEPDRWYAPNQLDKMLEDFGRTFPKEFKIRSKVKKRGEDMISKEGQAIRSALGFPKEAGGETEEWIVDRIRVLENAPWSMLTMSEAHQVEKDIKRLKAELRAARRKAGANSKEAGRLNLGRVVQTRGVSSKARENRAFGKEVQDAFRKYQRGDWGDTERDSAKRNNAVVKDGVEDQVFAVYDTSEGKMYIITEWDGSVTTMLFSHEY